MSNIILVRTPEKLLHNNEVGYGWPQVDFSQFATENELISHFKENNISIGRKEKQIRRYFNIRHGDIIIAPINRAIILAKAIGVKTHQQGVGYGENRISVECFRNQDGTLIRIPRNNLSNALSTRLKIRVTLANLDEFKDEVCRLLDHLEDHGAYSFYSHIEEAGNAAASTFKTEILNRIKHGKTHLESGGYGLEKLVTELLALEGYAAKTMAKSTYQGTADADIEAYKEDKFNSTKLLIQVKHHAGETDPHGIRQLDAINDEDAQLCLVTTANISEEAAAIAESKGIQIIGGEELSEWLYEHWQSLAASTKNRLGISETPVILG